MMDPRDLPTGEDYAFAAASDAVGQGRRNADTLTDLERRVRKLEETVWRLTKCAHQHYEE